MNAYLYWICLLLFISCQPSPVQTDHTKTTPPAIFPDYADVVFPANIAPPNFCIEEEGDAYYVVIGTEQEHFYSHKSKSNKVVIPEKAWHKLLKQQAGQDFFMRISVLQAGKWTQYADIKNSISTQEIDPFLSYRLLYPGYERWSDMGIYQRNLSNFEETVICDNKQQPNQCMNCHTSYKNDPDN